MAGLCVKVVFIAITSICPSMAFLPRLSPGDDNRTHTHAAITREGFTRAIRLFLIQNNYADQSSLDAIGAFFGKDLDNKRKFGKNLKDIITSNNRLQSNKRSEAMYSVNGERIQEAHNFICKTRMEIKDLVDMGLTDITKATIIEKIGRCLFVIQSFYSNTNWVDMNGAQHYPDFGVPGRSLMPIASLKTATCRDCTVLSTDGCKNTLIVTNKLTSGYRSGQDIAKFQMLQRRRSGKCSHGGSGDTSTNIPARGGINKETIDTAHSPLAHLHDQASKAAINATEAFFIGEGSGLLNDTGIEKFMTLFNLIKRKPNSLAFAIDVTGSMKDEIEAVRQTCLQKVTSVIGTSNEPANYVLTTFSDPESLTTQSMTTDGKQMLQKLRALTATGGDDCPEYSMSGVLKAIGLAKENSPVYLFTDADAKDCNQRQNVLKAAQSKNITIEVLLTGKGACTDVAPCSVRKRRSTSEMGHGTVKHRYKRSRALYEHIASATGGHVYKTTQSELARILNKLIQEDFPSSQVLIALVHRSSSASNEIYIPVDNDVELLKIEIIGSSSKDEASLRNPSGITEFTSRYYSSSKIIITMTKPVEGMWTLVRTTTVDWQIRVYAEASMYAQYQFLERQSDGHFYPIQGNPIAGQKYTLDVTVFSMIKNATNVSVAMIGENGGELSSLSLTFTESAYDDNTDAGIKGRTILETVNFYIQLQGQGGDRNMFQRMSEDLISPVNVKLNMGFITDDLYVGKSHNISYTLTNVGDNQTFTVIYKTSNAKTSTKNHFLHNGEVKDDVFAITGSSDGEVVEYTIFVTATGSRVVLQSLSSTVTFTSVQHPVCTVLEMSGDCGMGNLTYVTCASYTWSAQSEVKYSSVTLDNMYLTNHDSTTVMEFENITTKSSPFMIRVNGSCCSPSVFLNVIDEDGYLARCHFHFANPSDIETVIIPEIEISTKMNITDTTVNIPLTSSTKINVFDTTVDITSVNRSTKLDETDYTLIIASVTTAVLLIAAVVITFIIKKTVFTVYVVDAVPGLKSTDTSSNVRVNLQKLKLKKEEGEN